MFDLKIISRFISTVCYIGYLPLVPGTFGSLVGLLLYFLTRESYLLNSGCILSVAVLGFLTSGRAERDFQKKDCRFIVIDEVAGMLLGLAFLPYSLEMVVAGFFLFRLLDTLKPYPASVFQAAKGSIGIMGDDIVAGLYTNIILQSVFRFAFFKIS